MDSRIYFVAAVLVVLGFAANPLWTGIVLALAVVAWLAK